MKVNLLKYFKPEELFVMINNDPKQRFPLIKLNSNKKITHIRIGKSGSYFKSNLILNIDLDWFYISELLRTDGHISKDKLEIKLVNTDYILISKFVEFLKKLNIRYIRFEDNPNDYRVRIFNKTLAEILIRVFNIENGNKSLTTKIPNWMTKVKKRYYLEMLKGSFDGDGSVQFSKKSRTKRIKLNTGSIEYARDIKFLLKKLNINSKLFPDPREKKNVFYLQISRKADILRFAKIINFNHKKRSIRLNEIVNSYKRYSTDEIRDKILRIIEENPGITGGKLAKIINRSHSTTSAHLNSLKNKIKKIKIKQEKRLYLRTKKDRSFT